MMGQKTRICYQAADEKAERIEKNDIDRLFAVTGTVSALPASAAAEIDEFPDY